LAARLPGDGLCRFRRRKPRADRRPRQIRRHERQRHARPARERGAGLDAPRLAQERRAAHAGQVHGLRRQCGREARRSGFPAAADAALLRQPRCRERGRRSALVRPCTINWGAWIRRTCMSACPRTAARKRTSPEVAEGPITAMSNRSNSASSTEAGRSRRIALTTRSNLVVPLLTMAELLLAFGKQKA